MTTLSIDSLFLILGLLLVLSAFFSGSETALMSVNRYKLKHRVKKKDDSALKVNYLLNNPDKTLGLILLLNNFVNILASAITTLIAIEIIKELPILGESSLLASKFAVIIYLVDGPNIYEKFYKTLMRHNSQLNFEILNKIAKKVGSSIKDFKSQLNADKVNNVILKNLTLADKLSIDGTPTFIIEDNIFRGFISFEQLQEIIDNLRKRK